MIDVLERITTYRLQKGWTEYELAIKSNITQSTISSWYRKNIVPSIPSLVKICDTFDITLSQFFSEGDNNFTLTDTQQKLLEASATLSHEQQLALIEFIKTL